MQYAVSVAQLETNFGGFTMLHYYNIIYTQAKIYKASEKFREG